MKHKHLFVTTLNKRLYDSYANMLFETYKSTNQTIPLIVFTEDNFKIEGFETFNLFEHAPHSKEFADKHKNQLKEYVSKHPGVKEFRFDAVRFSYKVFAQNAARQLCDKMYFIDADIVFNKQVTNEVLNKLLPDDCFLSFFDRPASYTETGFVGFNLNKSCTDIFFKEYLDYYIKDKIFTLSGYLDCDVFDATRKSIMLKHNFKEHKLGDGGKAHIMARDKFFGQYFDHKKGERKSQKHSPEWIKNVR